MKRREFLKTSAITGSTITATTAGMVLPFNVFASPGYGVGSGRVVVNTMLLGGADLRHLFVPPPSTAYGEKFWASRESIFRNVEDTTTVWDPAATYSENYNEITVQGTTFGINNKADWLQQQILVGKVGIVCNVKASENQRHDHSQLIVNSGDPTITNYNFDVSGWGGRFVKSIGSNQANVLSYTDSISLFCFGDIANDRNAQVISAPDMRNVALIEPGSEPLNTNQTVIARALMMYYNKKDEQDYEGTPYLKILQHQKQLQNFGLSVKEILDGAEQSPALLNLINTSSGKLKSYAKQCSGIYDSLLVNQSNTDIVKFRAASLEFGGWDTHKNEKVALDSNFDDLFGLNKSLHTLSSEIEREFGADINKDITYIFTSDFGRQISSNGTNGTDHGKGTYTILIGDDVRGGVYGEMFPQREILPDSNDDSNRIPFDIPGAVIEGLTSYQRVLGELCDWAEAGSGNTVFPDRYTALEESDANIYQLFAKGLYDISGVVNSALGNAVVGASIVITSTSSSTIQWTTTTDNNGAFNIGSLAINGTYDVAVSKSGYLINGAMVTVNNGNAVLELTAVANEFYGTVSGRITTPDGKGIAGVELWDVGKYPSTVNTDKDGYYIIPGYQGGESVLLNANSQSQKYDIQASGWNGGFFTHDGSAIVAHNYIFTPKQGSISGYIVDVNGDGIAGVELWDVSKYPQTVTTDRNGFYIITGYQGGDNVLLNINSQSQNYAIQATGWDGSPFVHDGSSIVNRNYTFTRKAGTLYGRITTPDGKGAPNLTFWDVFKYPEKVTTDANGYYIISGYSSGDNIWFNTSSISNMGYSIKASGWIIGMFLHDGSDMQRDFIVSTSDANGTVSGRIITPDGKGIAGVELWDVGKYPSTVNTDKDGYYIIPGYQGGESVLLNANSQSQKYDIQASGWNGGYFTHDGSAIVAHNYIFTPKQGSISGYIVDANGDGIAGVELWDVSKYPQTVTTDRNGFYIITGYQGGDNVLLNINSQSQNYAIQATGWDGSPFVHDGSSIVNRNYTFTRKAGTLYGRITTPDGKGVPNLTFWDVFKYPEKVTTDANGYYIYNGFSAGSSVLFNVSSIQDYSVTASGWDGGLFQHDGSQVERNFIAVLK